MTHAPPDTRPVHHGLGSWLIPPGAETFSPAPFVLPNNVRVHSILLDAEPLEHLSVTGIVFGGLPVLFTPDRPTPLSTLRVTVPVETDDGGTTQEFLGYGWLCSTRFMGLRGMLVHLHLRNLGPTPVPVTALLNGEEIVPRG